MQERLLRKAYEDAKCAPSEVLYIEAHGTGTRLGDPIEIHAMSNVLGKTKRASGGRLLTASVKTNIGHLECGAGIASIIKLCKILEVRTVDISRRYCWHINKHLRLCSVDMHHASKHPLASPVFAIESYVNGDPEYQSLLRFCVSADPVGSSKPSFQDTQRIHQF